MIEVCVPMPVQVVIDDVGWWSGRNGGAVGQPYRTGIARDHVPADYAAIVELGRRLGIRPLAAMVLGEWDRDNILRDLPTATWMGPAWDNTRWVGPWLDEAAGILRDHGDRVEIALHGIAHEWWDGGRMSRAEWHDLAGQMRPADQIERHLDFYERLLERNGLGPMPRSFVPAAFLHRFGDGSDGMTARVARRGVERIFTMFRVMTCLRPPEHAVWGVDRGVLTIDRSGDLLEWDVLGPSVLEGEIPGPTCGTHWPNLLHADPARNGEVVERWVALLTRTHRRFARILATDTEMFSRQLPHHTLTRVAACGNQLQLDASAFFRQFPALRSSSVVVKLRLPTAALGAFGSPLPPPACLLDSCTDGSSTVVSLEVSLQSASPVITLSLPTGG